MSKEPAGSFKTHSNYIKALCNLVVTDVPDVRRGLYDSLKDKVIQSGILWQPGEATADLKTIRSCLHSAWCTEALLLMTGRITTEDELLRLSNNWSTIQTYYIFYHCTQALHVAKTQPRPESHPTTQKIFYDYWASRPIILPPWSLAFGVQGVKNVPTGLVINLDIHPWSANEGDNVWNLAIKALMTTRREVVDEKAKDYRKQKRSRLRKAWKNNENERLSRGKKARREPRFPISRPSVREKEQINEVVRPFTIMDYLYRLRIKTNYEDSNMFTDGPEEEITSRYVRNALCRLASATLFLHELAIRELVRRDVFLTWVDEWIQRNVPHEVRFGLANRRAALSR